MTVKMVDWYGVYDSEYYRAQVDNGESKTSLCNVCSGGNVSFYLKVPQEVRRCYFLDANAVNVLLELLSWGMLDGNRKRDIGEWFTIKQQVMALKLGLSENTISSKLQELERKWFIDVQKRGRRNYYRLNTMLNPFIVLSEEIHEYVQYLYAKKNYEAVMEIASPSLYFMSEIDRFQEAVTSVILSIVKDDDFYVPYMYRLLRDIRDNDGDDSSNVLYLPNYHSIVNDLRQDLLERIMHQFRLMTRDILPYYNTKSKPN
ncbi:helix-turn-helix transcriptional regulator [Brevibacillus sp. NPDC003359]|uniref:helix-turn-helix transcriptional regulator n=1 Tax=unclassified Brevibacillus TaxID=2684853 RepID=UPI0036C2F3C9